MAETIMQPTKEERDALISFAKRTGARWRIKLLDLWYKGKVDEIPEGRVLKSLRQRIKEHGHSSRRWVMLIRIPELDYLKPR